MPTEPGKGALAMLGARALRSGFLDLSTSMALVMGVGFLQGLVLARLLGPAGLGHVSIVSAAMGFATLVGGAGLSTAILRHSAAQPDDPAAQAVYRRALSFALLASVAVAILLAALTRSPLWVFDSVAGAWLPLSALALPALVLTTCSTALLQSRERIREKAALELGVRLLVAAAVIAGALGFGFPGFVVGALVGAWLGAGIVAWRVWRRASVQGGASPVPDRELVRFGSWSVLTQMLGFVLTTADIFCVSAITGDASAVGLYGLAVVIQRAARVPLMAYIDVRFPQLTRASSEIAQLRAVRTRMRGHLLLLSLACMGGAALLVPGLIGPVFGEAYTGSITPLWILLFGQVLWAQGAAPGRALLAAGWVEGNFWVSAAAATFNLVANLILIPHYGIAGAAVATATTHGLWAIAVTGMCRRLERRAEAAPAPSESQPGSSSE